MSDAGADINTEPEGEGLLTVTVVSGALIRDTDMIGSMSAYCTIVFNGKKLKTTVSKGTDKSPEWGDRF